MAELQRAKRWLPLSWTAVALLLAGCQSVPHSGVSVSSKSSLLAVDVLFPLPLRDPSLVQAFLVKGPVHGAMPQLPELVPPTFVKRSRAYWLDPEPGTYSLVAVSSAYAPPWNDQPIAGVSKTRWSGTSADAVVFPSRLIHQTRTTIAPGRLAFMGALRVRAGDRVNASAEFPDALQERLAEQLRPGVTSESGLGGWLKRTWLVDLEETSIRDEASDREAFLAAALDDLGTSPWAEVVARAASEEDATRLASAPARPPRPRTTVRSAPPDPAPPAPPLATADTPPVAISQSSHTAEPEAAAVEPEQTAKPEAAAVEPEQTAKPEAAAVEPEQTAKPEAAVVEPEQAPEPTVAVVEAGQAREPRIAALEPPAREPEPALPEPTPPDSEVVVLAAVPPPPAPTRERVAGIPPSSPLAEIEIGMSHEEVQGILGPPDKRIDRTTAKAWIPFHRGPGAFLRDWVYEGEGRVVFSLHGGALEVLDVVYEPGEGSRP